MAKDTHRSSYACRTDAVGRAGLLFRCLTGHSDITTSSKLWRKHVTTSSTSRNAHHRSAPLAGARELRSCAHSALNTTLLGIVKGGLLYPVVDTVDHRVYGLGARGVVELDEISGSERLILRVGRHRGIARLEVDPAIHRLLAEEIDFRGLVGVGIGQYVRAFAVVVDTSARREVSSIAVGRQPANSFDQDSVTIDTALHRGIVVDVEGRGALVDLRSGKLLARLHPGVPAFDEGDILGFAGSAVDVKLHRTAIIAYPPLDFTRTHHSTKSRTAGNAACDTSSCFPRLILIDSENGRIARRIPMGYVFAKNVVVDARRGRFVVFGDGGLRVLDAASGRTVRTVRLGVLVVELGIDPAVNNAFVLSQATSDPYGDWRFLRANLSNGGVSVGIRYGIIGTGNNRHFEPPTAAIDGAVHRLFVMNDTIGIFDTRTGSFLGKWRLTLRSEKRVEPFLDMAIDQSTHRRDAPTLGASAFVVRAQATADPEDRAHVPNAGSGWQESTHY